MDEDDAHGLRPDDVTVQLLVDGVPVATTPEWTATDTGDWTFAFRGLPRVNEDGEPIEYTIQVDTVDGYDVEVNGTDVTATLIPREPERYRQISGQKTWDDEGNAQGLRPKAVTLRLMRDGEPFATLTVSEAEGWSYSFGELPEDDGYGHVYTYELREDGVVGYFAKAHDMSVTNTLQLAQTPPDPEDEPLGIDLPESRKTGTPFPKFGGRTEAELEEQYDMFGYNTPRAGLLNTGDETPAWPLAFALALIALAVMGRKRKEKRE